jgi:hypothetical protein
MTLFVRMFSTTDFVNLFTKKQRKKYFFCAGFLELLPVFQSFLVSKTLTPPRSHIT